MTVTFTELFNADEFIGRHIGTSATEQEAQLKSLGFDSM